MNRGSVHKMILRALIIVSLLSINVYGKPSSEDSAAKSVIIESMRREWAGMSFQSTKVSKESFKFFSKALIEPPTGTFFGIIGLAIYIPVTIVSVPFDVLASPFRKKTTLKFSLKGTVVDENGTQIIRLPNLATVRACKLWEPAMSIKYFENTFTGEIGPDGEVYLPMNASFGPNKNFTAELDAQLPSGNRIKIANFIFKQELGRVSVASSSGEWRLVP